MSTLAYLPDSRLRIREYLYLRNARYVGGEALYYRKARLCVADAYGKKS